ncbi:MAG: T9SS type A sorting domain-containing protein [Chitinophagaceae bacterium]|nr:T9SS type A sorting domain-containing protein [Chitinophagaceae bacterium]
MTASYISTISLLFSQFPNPASRKYGISEIDLDNDTLKKLYSYPIYDQNDSNNVGQTEAQITSLLTDDKNHILTLYAEQNVPGNRYLIHITAIDSIYNIKWQKFVVSLSSVITPYTMTRLPNNGVAVVGVEVINMQVMKPLIFSLDSTGNLAPLNLTHQNPKNMLSLTVYPNPAKKFVDFHFDNLISGFIQILNSNGQTVITKPISYPDTKVDLGLLSPGVYIYNIISNSEKLLSNSILKID